MRMPGIIRLTSSISKTILMTIKLTTERKPTVIVAERSVNPQCSKRSGIFRFFNREDNDELTSRKRVSKNVYSVARAWRWGRVQSARQGHARRAHALDSLASINSRKKEPYVQFNSLIEGLRIAKSSLILKLRK